MKLRNTIDSMIPTLHADWYRGGVEISNSLRIRTRT